MSDTIDATAHRERAVIWVADDDDWQRWAARCADYCARRGYQVVAIIHGHAGGRWADVDAYVMAGHADLAVVADRGQLPRDRAHRVESVAEERHRPEVVQPQTGRPAFLRRDS